MTDCNDLARVVVDTTVQPKAVMFPTDAKLVNRARERLVRLAKKLGVTCLAFIKPKPKFRNLPFCESDCPVRVWLHEQFAPHNHSTHGKLR